MTAVKIWGVWCCLPQGLWQRHSVLMFGQIDIENLFLKRSGVIYDTTNKKNLPPELTEFILVLHWILLLTHHPVSTDDTVFSTNWTSVTDHQQMFWWMMAQMRTYRQLIEYRLRIATTAMINLSTYRPGRNSMWVRATTRLPVSLATLPQLKMLRTYTHCVPITPLKIGWKTQCCMAGRRFKENSTPFIRPQACTRVPDVDKAAQLPDQMRNKKCPCAREEDFG